jgi:hypothetical protein
LDFGQPKDVSGQISNLNESQFPHFQEEEGRPSYLFDEDGIGASMIIESNEILQ